MRNGLPSQARSRARACTGKPRESLPSWTTAGTESSCPFILVVLLSLALPLTPVAAQSQQATQGKQWQVRYVTGMEKVATRTPLQLTVTPERITGRTKDDVVVSIPVATVLDVAYDNVANSTANVWLNSAKYFGDPREFGEASPLLASPFLVAAAVAASLQKKEHFVIILWQEEGGVRTLRLQVAKNNYLAVLKELQTVRGKHWRNLPQERKRLRQELGRSKKRKIPLFVDRAVLVGESDLEPGLYQVILLQRGENRGELYFFAGKKVDSRHVAAQALVEIEKHASDHAAAQAMYSEVVGGPVTISQIQVPEKTLRLPAFRVPAEVQKAAHSSYAGRGWWLIISYLQRDAEAAFRFPVVHDHPGERWDACRGFLYVTRDRIVYDPEHTPGRKDHAFSVPRTSVKVAERIATEGHPQDFLEIASPERVYQFLPVYERGGDWLPILPVGGRKEAMSDFARFLIQVVADFDAAEKRYVSCQGHQCGASTNHQETRKRQ